MIIKDLNIKIAMALTLVMMGSPAVKVFAAENTTEPKTTNEILNMDGQTYTNFLIDEFHREYGTADKFEKVYEGDGIREEVNGKTGNRVYAGSLQTYVLSEDGKITNSVGLQGYLMGTDGRGRDVFTRIVHGGKMTMTVGGVVRSPPL